MGITEERGAPEATGQQLKVSSAPMCNHVDTAYLGSLPRIGLFVRTFFAFSPPPSCISLFDRVLHQSVSRIRAPEGHSAV